MRAGQLKLLIVDDEMPARSRLREMVNDTGGWTVIAEASNGREALHLCEAQAPDVVLLDIRMPEMDGMEVASHLGHLPVPPAVIFTTAYDEYAVKAFDTHAVAYLLKPVRRERLLQALEHAARLSRMQMMALTQENPEFAARKNIPVSLSGKISLVPVEGIISFHADQKYVRMVHSSAGGPIQESLIDEPLKALEAEFASDFVRVHRNSVLRATAIQSLQRNEAGQYSATVRDSGETVPVSRRHIATLKQRLK
ncbi:MAG: response regulator transcription factor [Gammaproteobacteria bacterium]|nr:MAG: response regulator transcription factor [Gammaproteobacteria bacterium]